MKVALVGIEVSNQPSASDSASASALSHPPTFSDMLLQCDALGLLLNFFSVER